MSVSINGTSGLVFNDASVQNTAASGFGFKNRILNGRMVIDQRNSGASVSATSAGNYDVDRWWGYGPSTRFTMQQTPSATETGYATRVAAGFTNYLGVTSTSAYSVGAAETFGLFQNIEGFNIADLAWGTAAASAVTLSFWVRSSLTGSFGGAIQNSAFNRAYPFTFSITSANTWEYKTITVAGDTSGTWATNNTTGLRLQFSMGSGGTVSTTAGAWAAGNFNSVTGATSVVGTSGATFYITGVQLEKGSTATSFDYRPYGTELALCQRYFQLSGNGTGQAFSANTLSINYALPVTMRDNPSGTYVNGTNGLIRFGGSNESFSSIGVYVSRQNFVGSNLSGSGYGVGSIYMTATQGAINFSAEL